MFGVSSLGAYLQAKFFGSLSSYTDTRNLSSEILNRQPQSTEDQRFFNQIPKRIGSKPKIFPASYDAASFDAALGGVNLFLSAWRRKNRRGYSEHRSPPRLENGSSGRQRGHDRSEGKGGGKGISMAIQFTTKFNLPFVPNC